MTVGRICVGEVDTAQADESVQAAGQRMHNRKVGTLVVVDELTRPIGIVTDRDLAIRVVGRGADPFSTTIRDVMTDSPYTIRDSSSLEATLVTMRAAGCRRLPVVDSQGKLVGLVSLDDIFSLLAGEFDQITKLLEEESPASLTSHRR